ncbi:MAG TPA: two-component regulator propeller domain-containing protein [Candidatus Limnocylindrales bacterium]|nr:two-component regulator propeller domain-containing protein [Candidatus Limnocylindrales bacterium]
MIWRAVQTAVAAGLLQCAGLTVHAETTNLPEYFMRVWQTQNGLPDNAVETVVQTRDGYLWLATYDGLARFDGVAFTVFDNNNTPEMRSSRVTSLFEDAEGNLWIGCESGELTRYRDGHFYSVSFHPPWESRKIQNIGADASGMVWLLNPSGKLVALDGQAVAMANTGGAVSAVTLTQSPRGTIWVFSDGEVYTLDRGRLLPIPVGLQSQDFIEWICSSADGGLWMMTRDRVLKWEGTGTQDFGPSPLGPSSVTAMMEMASGGLAVGTLQQGLFLIFPHRGVVHFDRAHGFPNNWVRSLCEDREGTLWVGTGNSGLVALRPSRVTTLTPPDDWQGANVLSVTCSRRGSMWIGTEGAGLYHLQNGEWTHFGDNSGLLNLFVWSVSEDSGNQLWAGTWGGGLFLQHSNQFARAPGLENFTAPVLAILPEREGVTWIGTDTGLMRYQAGAVTSFGAKQNLVLPDVRTVTEAPDGTVWFGMMGGGLGRWQHGVVKQFRKADGLSSDFVQSLHLDTEGALWIGTYGGGLDRLRNGRFSSVQMEQGLPNNFICAIEQDDHGNFWVSSHGGIFRIQKKELNQCADGQIPAVHPLVYGTGDGMPTLECSGGFQPASCWTSDGRLWFSTSKGPVGIDPDHIKVNQLPPPVLIEKVLMDGRPVEGNGRAGGALRIPPGRHQLEFRYTGLSFVAPEKVSFKYRLQGSDQEWTDAGTKRAVIYNYVPPGRYRFEVMACNSDGIWSTASAVLAFTVHPFFWQIWWFYVVAGVSAAAMLTGGVFWIARRRMLRKLDRLERQRAIERERTRIARDIHDNLGANLTRISLLSQSVQGELQNPEQAAVQLNRIYDTTRELTRALDEIVWAVNPEHDTLDSLANYLGKFARNFLEPLAIRCRLDLPVQLPPWPVTAEVRHNLFLAFKEALHNVVKHAAASEVSISLTTDARAFTLRVRDHGRGFVPEPLLRELLHQPGRSASGNGLRNMHRRLEKIGGRCEIRSAPGQGTEVQFIVPVSSDQPDSGPTHPPTPEPGANPLPADVAKSSDKPFFSDVVK